MSLVVVLLEGQQASPVLASDALHELVQLGVTDIVLTSGPSGSALVLSGWSLDGRRHERRVLELVAAGAAAAVQHEVADLTLLPVHAGPDLPGHPSTQRSNR